MDTQTVDLRDDRFTLPIGSRVGRFSAVQLRNRNNPVFVRTIRIVFGDGSIQTVRVNATLPAGGYTGVIDLQGRGRFIRQVVIRTRDQNRRIRTELELVGREFRAPPPPPPPVSAGGWKTVGSSTFRLRSKSTAILVGKQRGRLAAIKLRAEGRPVTIRSIVIVYANGEQQAVRLATRIFPGTQSAPIKLTGRNGRFIRHIAVIFKRKRFSNRRATLQVLGRAANQGQWISLGQRRADMFQPVRDTFIVGRNRGRFVKIKLQSRRRHVRIYSVTVTFGNGQTRQLPFSGGLRGNTATPVINLDPRGRARFVASVQVLHKSKISFKGEGSTEVLLQN